MDEQAKLVGPELREAFTCWFNAGDIDFADQDDVMHRADIVASVLMQTGLTREAIVAPLREALCRFDDATFEEFNAAGQVAWDFSDESEQMLRTVLTRIIDAVEEQVP